MFSERAEILFGTLYFFKSYSVQTSIMQGQGLPPFEILLEGHHLPSRPWHWGYATRCVNQLSLGELARTAQYLGPRPLDKF